MNHVNFNQYSQDYLNQLYNLVEANYPTADAELSHDKLLINLTNKKSFLITIHHTLHQIWLASPLSGAHHFFYDKDESLWISTRNHNSDLMTVLKQELADITQ